MKIYLAGKIAKNDWRHEIVKELRGTLTAGGDRGSDESADWPVLRGAIFARHDYVGPFFASCDHGCFHGPHTHGLSAGTEAEGGGYALITRQEVVGRCLRGLESADLVFAWLDSTSAYGTLVEVGIAFGLGKRLAIGIPKDLPLSQSRDLWFALQLVEPIEADSPVAALRVATR